MHPATTPRPSACGSQTGFSMIEVLVTLLIISLALLGTAGLQAYSMRLNQGGQFRTQAVFLVADLAERIEANKGGATDGSYQVANSDVPAVVDNTCTAGTCVKGQLATFDLSQWQNVVAATLPQSSWTVAHDGPANPITYTITVGWVDRRNDKTDAAFVAGTNLAVDGAGLGRNAAGTGERFYYSTSRTVYLSP